MRIAWAHCSCNPTYSSWQPLPAEIVDPVQHLIAHVHPTVGVWISDLILIPGEEFPHSNGTRRASNRWPATKSFLHTHIFTTEGENCLGACADAFQRRHRPADEASLRLKCGAKLGAVHQHKSNDPSSVLWRSAAVQCERHVGKKACKNSSWGTSRRP